MLFFLSLSFLISFFQFPSSRQFWDSCLYVGLSTPIRLGGLPRGMAHLSSTINLGVPPSYPVVQCIDRYNARLEVVCS